MSLSHTLYTTGSIVNFEQDLFQTKQASAEQFMQTAGQAAFNLLKNQYPAARCIAVFCGSGNNGGDGFVLAKEAKKQQMDVTVYLMKQLEALTPLVHDHAKQCQAMRIPIILFDGQALDLSAADVLVDALLGSGLQGSVSPSYASLIHCINQSNQPVLAIDAPSGLNTHTGEALGTAVQADCTLTFIGKKQGLFTGDGLEYSGTVFLNTLNIPSESYALLFPSAYLFNPKLINKILKKRPRTAHKGCYGHVLVIGGERSMAGAARMAATAALRVGAGRVSAAVPPENCLVINAVHPEIMSHAVKEATVLQPLLSQATIIVIGPGLGKHAWGSAMLIEALQFTDTPMLIDADALNLITEQHLYPQLSRIKRAVITPHPGEAARLLTTSVKKIQQNRFDAAKALQDCTNATVILKGAGTIIQPKDSLPIICTVGNPGMATAGMGDILSGVVAGLLAQGLSDTDAAQIGVYLHGKAADLAAESLGERGLTATDLLPILHQLSNPS
jgi:hydroxyethylthiazole kinase-like uncharacterized protein yjeF